MQQFRTFYRELFDIKQCIEAQRWSELSASPSPDGVSSPSEAAPRAVFARLYRVITGQGFGLHGRERGDGAPVDVGYVMAAVADEVLLHGPAWPGQETWSATLLEEALYGTRIAGERIFRTAHELLAGQLSRSAVAVSVLLALMLGFRGRYHGTDDRGEITALKERLFGVIFHLPYPVDIDFQTLLSEGELAARPNQFSCVAVAPPLADGNPASCYRLHRAERRAVARRCIIHSLHLRKHHSRQCGTDAVSAFSESPPCCRM